MKTKIYLGLTLIFIVSTFSKSFSQANTSLSNLVSNTAVNHSLVPGNTGNISLGSSTIGWKNLYLTGVIYKNGVPVFYTPLDSNTFVGLNAGSTAVTGKNNTATGYLSLRNITSGYNNTANGYLSLYNNSTGARNVSIGDNAMYANTGGNYNTAVGSSALNANTTGSDNTAVGLDALGDNTTGNYNTSNGFQALNFNNTGSYNTATGDISLYSNTTGSGNTANGYGALYNNSTGSNNTATGNSALENITTGNNNTATGNFASFSNTTGSYNTAEGNFALGSNTTGSYNVANGDEVLHANSGSNNSGTGAEAFFQNTTGSNNTANGYGALYNNTSGSYNAAIGEYALTSNTTGVGNTAIGHYADVSEGNLTNATAIGNDVTATASNQVRVGNSAVTSIGGYANFTNISDGRVKKNIKQNVPGLAFINKLQPITYNFDLNAADKITQTPQRKDATGKVIQPTTDEIASRQTKEKITYTGFIAQDVEKAAKSLNYDFSGVDAAKNDKDLYGLRYAEFVVPLVKAVQELSSRNDSLQNQVNELRAMIVSSQSTSQQSATVALASLAQNVPNPFGSSTSISYSLPQNYSSAKLIVTDNNGVALKQINLNAKGNGNVLIDASTLSSGAYRYSLYVDGKLIDSKQMISSK